MQVSWHSKIIDLFPACFDQRGIKGLNEGVAIVALHTGAWPAALSH